MGDCVGSTYGGGTPSTSHDEYWGGDIPWIQSSNVLENELFRIDIPKAITQDGLSKSAALQVPGDSIAVVTHVGVGKLVYLPFPYATSQDFVSLSGLKGDANFLCYAIHRKLQSELHMVQGSAIKGITKEELLGKAISLPAAEEQKLMGNQMRAIDNLITLHQRECWKVSFIRPSAWEQRKLGEFSKKRTTKNADSALSETFTNSAEQGVISQLDYFDHGITNDANISGYYVVQPDDFVYNPRISATAPCGPINRNRLNRAGVMSPLYTVFSVDSSVDKTYLEHYFKTSRWHVFMLLEGNSGARSDRFSISEATFFEMPIWCPEASEQRAIARQLETTDALITLHQCEPRVADTGYMRLERALMTISMSLFSSSWMTCR